MPPWISSYFLNPSYVLPGAALIAAPILIHLINRMRYRRVKFAAMEFLLASQQRHRKRLLFEQLLLLLLRIIVVLAIVALIARPQFDPEQLSFFQGQKTHHLVLLDDSGSMRDHWGETSAFASGADVIKKIAAEGARRPGTQTLTLLLLSRPNDPVFTMKNLDPAFLAELDGKLKSLECSHRQVELIEAIESSRKLLVEQPGTTKQFHFVSDFRRRDWQDDAALPTALHGLAQEKIAINLIKTVPLQHANLGVTDLSGNVEVAAANVPLRLQVTVRNYGAQVAQNVRLAVLADGKKLPLSVGFESLEPGKETSREFDVIFPNTGPHEVRVILPADALEQDNTRYLALDIPDSNPVLVIDGDPAAGGAFYLTDALAPAPGITGFAPTIETVEYLRRHPLDRFQCIFMVNVAELPPDSLRVLEEYVKAGGGLVWYLGEQVRAGFYNEKLYAAGAGLFPAPLGSMTKLVIDETNPAPDLEFQPVPLFRVFEGQDNPFIESVKIDRYFSTAKDWKPQAGVRVLARLRNQAPLFLEHTYGKGTVVTCLTSCGVDWNNWPRNPSFVVMQLELEKHVARSQHGLDRRIVGEPIQIALDAAQYSPNVEIRLPGGATEKLTAVIAPTEKPPAGTKEPVGTKSPAPSAAPAQTNQKLSFADEFANTDQPGVYAVIQKRTDGSEESRRMAYNVPAAENQLELITTEAMKQTIGPDVPVQIQEVGSFDWIHGEQAGQEFHDLVLGIMLAFLMGEQLLALKLSYHPRPTGARA